MKLRLTHSKFQPFLVTVGGKSFKFDGEPIAVTDAEALELLSQHNNILEIAEGGFNLAPEQATVHAPFQEPKVEEEAPLEEKTEE